MKIRDAISSIDEQMENNGYSREEKIKWLSRLDQEIHQTIILRHEKPEPPEFAGYTPETPEDTELLVPEPYDDLYTLHLECEINYRNKDFELYNASTIAFNDRLSAYEAWYELYHRPISRRIKYF